METARRDVMEIARSLVSQLRDVLHTHAAGESLPAVSAVVAPCLPSYVGLSLRVRSPPCAGLGQPAVHVSFLRMSATR